MFYTQFHVFIHVYPLQAKRSLTSRPLIQTFISFLYNGMCTCNTISSHTDHFKVQKSDSDESILTFVNLFPSYSILEIQ